MGSGAESSNLKCLADKWSNLQFHSMGSDSDFSNPIEPEVRFRHFAHTMGSMLINKVTGSRMLWFARASVDLAGFLGKILVALKKLFSSTIFPDFGYMHTGFVYYIYLGIHTRSLKC